MSSSLRYILSATAALALASVTQATPTQVINWSTSANYSGANGTFQGETLGGGNSTSTTWTAPFNILSPGISGSNSTTGFGSGYTGPAIYGGGFGASANRGASATFAGDVLVYRGGDTPEVLRVQNTAVDNTVTTEVLTARALILFASNNVTRVIGAGASMNLTAARSTSNSTASARWAVVSGGNVYLSNSTIALVTNNNQTVYGINTLSTESFGLWTPTSDFNISAVTYNTLGSSLAGIQFAGVYYEATNTGGSPSVFNMSGFEATMIPEPSTYAAILGLGAISIVAYRRFKSKKA